MTPVILVIYHMLVAVHKPYATGEESQSCEAGGQWEVELFKSMHDWAVTQHFAKIIPSNDLLRITCFLIVVFTYESTLWCIFLF